MLHMLVICFNLLLIPAAHARYPECREGEKGGISDLVFILKNASQGKICLPEVECEVEGCKEGGTICRKILKPRSP